MAKAKKLKSGSWRCLVYDYTDADGKRHYKSFTCNDTSTKGKRKCEMMAAEWAATKESKSHNKITFGEAIDYYISSREAVLSPCSIRDYRNTRNNHIQSLMPIKIDDITQKQIQIAINIEAAKLSPKSVRNIHGLISAVMKIYRPEFAINTALPKRNRPNLYIPSDKEVQQIMDAAKGTELELPILLAAFGPMRRGEICALESSDISGNIVHVCKNMVRTPDGKWIIKPPKSYAGDRYIEYPRFVAEKWKGKEGKIVNLKPHNITNNFIKLLEKEGLPHFRFHDLRHYSASIQHALGIPDSYIMQRGGWGNDGVLKSVYRHALSDKTIEMNQIANTYFEGLCNTKYNMENKKAQK